MPVSSEHNCVFVHIPKTAGSSIEVALGMTPHVDKLGITPGANRGLDKDMFFGSGLQHLPARKLKKHRELPIDFEKAFKFTFVRNPWARVISAITFKGGLKQADVEKPQEYYARKISRLHKSFKAGNRIKAKHFRAQTWFFQDGNGNQLVDFVGRFENLQEDFAKVTKTLGLDVELEHRMPSNHKPFREMYTPEMVDQVAEIYAKDIAALGYTFD